MLYDAAIPVCGKPSGSNENILKSSVDFFFVEITDRHLF
jgi:hypothetical protein